MNNVDMLLCYMSLLIICMETIKWAYYVQLSEYSDPFAEAKLHKLL